MIAFISVLRNCQVYILIPFVSLPKAPGAHNLALWNAFLIKKKKKRCYTHARFIIIIRIWNIKYVASEIIGVVNIFLHLIIFLIYYELAVILFCVKLIRQWSELSALMLRSFSFFKHFYIFFLGFTELLDVKQAVSPMLPYISGIRYTGITIKQQTPAG